MNETTGNIKIRESEDIDLLSDLFSQLAEDEEADVKRSRDDFRENMECFLDRGDKAFLFTADGAVIGYALVIMDRCPYYIRHFFICRSARRSGFGTSAFHMLLETLGTDQADLDVFVWNERGKAFWNSLGFKPRATIMRYGA